MEKSDLESEVKNDTRISIQNNQPVKIEEQK